MTGKFNILCVFLLQAWFLLMAPAYGQDRPAISYHEPGKAYLRWPALHQPGLEGYHVYRKIQGGPDWVKLTVEPVTMVRSVLEIRQQAGFKADLYLQLFGAGDPPQDISNTVYQDLINNPGSLAFLDVMALVNPEFGPLMGVVYVDSVNLPAGIIQYKVTTLSGGRETDYALSREIDSRIPASIPAVTGLAGEPSNQSARLTWAKNQTDLKSGQVVSYAVYRSGNLLGPYEKVNLFAILPVTISSGNMTSRENTEAFSDKYLENGKTFYYFVRAVNAFGIEGPASATIEITPGDDRLPDAPRSLETRLFGTGLRISWEPVASVAGYEVFKSHDRKGEYRRIYPVSDVLLKPDTFMIDLDVKTATSYYYFVTSVRAGGLRSHPSDTIPVFLEDKTPPARPGPVTLTPEKGRILLKWPASVEEDVIGYEVERASDDLFRSRFLLTNDILNDTVFIDTLPDISQTTYGYVVYAIDRSYNRSAASDMAKGRMPDGTPPSAPVITGLSRNGRHVQLRWTRSTDRDLAGYRIYRGVSSSTALKPYDISLTNSFTDTLETSGRYFYAVSALDSAGNESRSSGLQSLDYEANEVPETAPGGKAEKSGNFIRVEWLPATQPGTAGYLVTREEVETGKKLDVAEVKQGTNSYTDRFARTDKAYIYYIRTFDERWRMSEPLVVKYEGTGR